MMLADFGLSIDATEERPVTRAGTLDYMAPEVCTASLHHPDTWALRYSLQETMMFGTSSAFC